jgi:thiol peroxidase
MATITVNGDPIETYGELPAVGSQAPDFTLVKSDMSEISLSELAGKKVILNIFLSLDTDVCANSVRHFNEAANQLENTVVLCISADLPFAHARFCGAEGLDNVITASVFRNPEFGKDYGVTITTGPAGLLSRSVVVIDESGKVIYTEQVPETVNEPDYEAALKALS